VVQVAAALVRRVVLERPEPRQRRGEHKVLPVVVVVGIPQVAVVVVKVVLVVPVQDQYPVTAAPVLLILTLVELLRIMPEVVVERAAIVA
jgi:hypothetical protein